MSCFPRVKRLLWALSLLGGALVLLGGCTYDYTLQQSREWRNRLAFFDSHWVSRSKDWVLPASSPLYIAQASREMLATERTSGERGISSRQLSEALAHSLERQQANLITGRKPVNLQQAFTAARHNRCTYLIYPRLLTASDSIGSLQELDADMEAFPGMGSDYVVVQLAVYEVSSKKRIDTFVLQSQSGWLAFYRQQPEVLMAEGFDRFSEQLFARPIP